MDSILKHFHPKMLAIGAIAVILLFVLFRMGCNPGPQPGTNRTVTDSSFYSEKTLDSLRILIRNLQLQLTAPVPSSDSITGMAGRIDTVRVKQIKVVHERDTEYMEVAKIERDSCRAVVLHQFVPIPNNGGYYEITGVVSCVTDSVYNLHVEAHANVTLEFLIRDTTVQGYVKREITREKNHWEQEKTAIAATSKFGTDLYVFGGYDALFTRVISLGGGASVSWKDLELDASVGLAIAPANTSGTGLVSSVGASYHFLR